LKQKINVIHYLILSIVAATLLIILAAFNISNTTSVGIHDKLFMGGMFITSCLFGISLAVYPGWFKRFIKQEKLIPTKNQIQKTARKRKGHHPDCIKFKDHTIRIKNKIFCAGCLGLSIGSILSIALMILYIVVGNELSFTTFYFFMFLGLILIGLVYIEIMIPIRHTTIHIISNVFLVISFLLIVVCIFEITGNKIYGGVSMLLSFLWLDTRIRLSNLYHTWICKNCSEPCKMY